MLNVTKHSSNIISFCLSETLTVPPAPHSAVREATTSTHTHTHILGFPTYPCSALKHPSWARSPQLPPRTAPLTAAPSVFPGWFSRQHEHPVISPLLLPSSSRTHPISQLLFTASPEGCGTQHLPFPPSLHTSSLPYTPNSSVRGHHLINHEQMQ